MLTACSRPALPSVQRVALLPFDNLTGDASLDWLRLAVPKTVAAQLTGTASTLPFYANALRDAENGMATRYVHGYFDRRAGVLHFEASIEDASTHKMSNAFSAGVSWLGAAGTFAKSIDDRALPFSTSQPEAADAWGKGDYERATSLDPDFGAAWVSWTEALTVANQPAKALEVASKAAARASLRSAIDRAEIEGLLAGLKQDNLGRIKALKELQRLVPNDLTLPTRLADLEMRARQFPEAVAQYEELVRRNPEDPAARNALGYAYAFAGDLAKSQRAFEEYGRLPGQEPNSLDSLGEAYFLHGRFQEAEKLFLASHEKNPRLALGGDLLKAAYAHWLSGDLPGADQIFGRYLQFRQSAGDQLLVWRRSVWLYATGRTELARQLLADQAGPGDNIARQQYRMWQSPDAAIPSDVAALRASYTQKLPSAGGLAGVLYAQALLKEGKKDEAREILRFWPLPEAQEESLLGAFLYPKYKELREKVR